MHSAQRAPAYQRVQGVLPGERRQGPERRKKECPEDTPPDGQPSCENLTELIHLPALLCYPFVILPSQNGSKQG